MAVTVATTTIMAINTKASIFEPLGPTHVEWDPQIGPFDFAVAPIGLVLVLRYMCGVGLWSQ